MIDAVSQHILERLGSMKLKIGDKVRPLKIYPPEPHREQGITELPCIAVSVVGERVDKGLSRPDDELFVPSVARSTVELPDGTTTSGPQRYTVQRYPTPERLLYQLDVRATAGSQARQVMRMLCHAIPDGYQPVVSGYVVTFDMQDPQNLDDLAKPQYWTAVRYWVHDIWIQRYGSYEVPSITETEMPMMVDGQPV